MNSTLLVGGYKDTQSVSTSRNNMKLKKTAKYGLISLGVVATLAVVGYTSSS